MTRSSLTLRKPTRALLCPAGRALLIWGSLAIFCSACGESIIRYDDCRNHNIGCPQPLACQPTNEGSDLQADFHCSSPRGTTVTCMEVPEGQAVTYKPAGFSFGPPLHWTSGPCLSLSYQAELAPRAQHIADAAKAWTFSCSKLCFNPPTASETPPREDLAERRIHFSVTDKHKTGNPLQANPFLEVGTGRILGMTISFERAWLLKVPACDITRWLGHAIGLDAVHYLPPPLDPSEPDLYSIMEDRSDWRSQERDVTAPSAEDKKAVCRLYGTPSLCGD